jgi:hypothetical protein
MAVRWIVKMPSLRTMLTVTAEPVLQEIVVHLSYARGIDASTDSR